MGSMGVAGLLLTGGASRRLGQDKGTLVLDGAQESLARRTARLLAEVAQPVLEVGPGHSGLPAVLEDPPGAGPLVALAAGARELRAQGWTGPTVVLATDLPRLTRKFLAWLAAYPTTGSVIPVVDGHPQTLCARYAAPDLDVAVELAARGRRALRELLPHLDALFADPALWEKAAGAPDVMADIDTPLDLARLRAGPC
jgi:molybdopterin-guanine dinucleotide biosynthesis protein A